MDLGVEPPDQALALQDRQHVVAVNAVLPRHEGLEAVVEAEQAEGAPAVAQNGIERRQQADARRRRRQGGGAGFPVG